MKGRLNLGARTVKATVLIEHREMSAGIEEHVMFMLAVKLDQSHREIF